MNAVFTGRVEKGKLILNDPDKMRRVLATLEGCEVEVPAPRKKRKKRSLNQNSYYRGVVIKMLAEFLGYDEDDMHHMMRAKFLSFTDDKGIEASRSTTTLSTVEMEEYLERIRQWAESFLHFRIALPNEVDVSVYDQP